MTDDPMDQMPDDHGSDRYDAIVLVEAPEGVKPEPALVSWYDRHGCSDCNPNFFYHWRSENPSKWFVQIAHDDGCPSFARLEKEGVTRTLRGAMPRGEMDKLLAIAREHHPDVMGVVVLHGAREQGMVMSAWSSDEGPDPQGWLHSMVRHAFEDPGLDQTPE
jgi:hypothetical protein